MNLLRQRRHALLGSFGFACVALLLCAISASAQSTIRVEAEKGRLTGTTVASEGTGYSGTGYVTGFRNEGDSVHLTVNASAGLYTVRAGYRATQEKGYDLRINDASVSGMFQKTEGNKFAVADLGKVELKAGANTLVVQKGWGYYDLDFIEFVPAQKPPLPHRLPATLVDAKATPATRALMQRLVKAYGTSTLSGQYDIGDADYVQKTAGVSPAILGGDLIEYSPSRVAHGSKPQGSTEKLIRTVKRDKYVLTLSWHWNAPTQLKDRMEKDAQGKEVNALWYKGFYTNATTFDVEKALANPQSPEYRLLLRDMDAIAVELKKYAAADVPILWRPLHESEGGWFWWGAKGPEPLKKLWRLMYDRLTNYHQIHNLIWVFTSGTNSQWYPGDRYVDIVGVDAYPQDYHDALSGTWEPLRKTYDGKKLLALTEFGKVPDIDRMYRYGVYWSYFVSWSGELGAKGVTPEELRRTYRNPVVRNRP